MSTLDRKVWIVPEGTQVDADVVSSAKEAGAGEIAVGVPASLAKVAPDEIPEGGCLVVERVAQPEPVASVEQQVADQVATLAELAARVAELEARIAELEKAR
jgi:ubiquinone biosynthesis protein UbiJ